MIRRYYGGDYRFVCLSDHTIDGIDTIEVEHRGWWSKIELFRPGRFDGRVVYFDLDVVLTGNLDPIVNTVGIIKDWNGTTFNSSVMSWDAGTRDHIWESFTTDAILTHPGDQDWITKVCPEWPTYPEEWCLSYRWQVMGRKAPEDCLVVVFHGQPKPWGCPDKWVHEVYKIGGSFAVKLSRGGNVDATDLLENMRHAVALGLPDVQLTVEPRKGTCHIVGGGPTLDKFAAKALRRVGKHDEVWALNNAHAWLLGKGIRPHSSLLLDAREHNVRFFEKKPEGIRYLIASQCHPNVFERLKDRKVELWHNGLGKDWEAKQYEILTPKGYEGPKRYVVGGGGNVGLRAMFLAFLMGFRRLELWGMPSCILNGAHHAYAQSENDMEAYEIVVPGNGKTYAVQGWMHRQADEFWNHWSELTGLGATIEAHGEGLLPDLCRLYNERGRYAAVS